MAKTKYILYYITKIYILTKIKKNFQLSYKCKKKKMGMIIIKKRNVNQATEKKVSFSISFIIWVTYNRRYIIIHNAFRYPNPI